MFLAGNPDEDKVAAMKVNSLKNIDHSIRLLVLSLFWVGTSLGQVPRNSSNPLQVQSARQNDAGGGEGGSGLPFLNSQPTSPPAVPDFLSSITSQNNQRSPRRKEEDDGHPVPTPQAQVQRRPPFSDFNSIDDEQRSNDRERQRQNNNGFDRDRGFIDRNRNQDGSRINDADSVRDRDNQRDRDAFNNNNNNNRFGEDRDQDLPFGRSPRPQDPFSSFGSTTNRNRNNQDPRQRVPDQAFPSFNNNVNNQRQPQTPNFPFGGSSSLPGSSFNYNQNTRNTLIKEP